MKAIFEFGCLAMISRFCFFAFLIIYIPLNLFAAEVTFRITGLRNDLGVVWVGVYKDAESFLKRGKQITECKQNSEISDGKVDVTCSVEPGTYGVAAYHDENVNKKLDRGFLGFPKEGYAFPNDVRPVFNVPDFEEVLISVGEDNLILDLNFQYYFEN